MRRRSFRFFSSRVSRRRPYFAGCGFPRYSIKFDPVKSENEPMTDGGAVNPRIIEAFPPFSRREGSGTTG
jgi:hypothetical protein